MSKKSIKVTRCLMGQSLGWGDDRLPHRYIKLATLEGELAIKIPKHLRLQVQTWQIGEWLAFTCQERIDCQTGARRLKIKELGADCQIASDRSTTADCSHELPLEPSKIKICQGSSCRRKGSDKICQAICAYLTDHNLSDRVEIETTKCLHQCKAAPHAIFSSSMGKHEAKKTHYRQLQTDRLQAILARYWPQALLSKSIGFNLTDSVVTDLYPDRCSPYTN